MSLVSRWLPRSLASRIFALHSTILFAITFAGLGLFYHQQLAQAIDEAHEATRILANVLTPTLSDSVVVGDYDAIRHALATVASGPLLASAEFIDAAGVRLRAENEFRLSRRPPQWITAHIAGRLHPINRGISVGGRDYGVFSLHHSPESIANGVATVTEISLMLAAFCLLAGHLLIWLPLRRMVKDLKATARFARELPGHLGGALVIDTTVSETRYLVAALNRVSRQLTAQHRALTDSESRKSAITEAALDCFIAINDAGEIVDFNAAAERTFGFRAAEVRGQTLAETIIPVELRAAHEQGMKHYLATGSGPILRKRIEITAIRRSGERFPVEVAIVPFEAEGRTYFAGYIRDITERKALEAERGRVNGLLNQSLRELEQQKFALDQHSIVSITDAAGAITYANQKLFEISGHSRDELLGQNHRIFKSTVHPPAFYHQLWETISTGKVWHGEIANCDKNGSVYWVAATIVPWLDDAGLPYQYVAIGTDITAQKQVGQALADARLRELETGSEIQRLLLLSDLPEDLHGASLATYIESSQGIAGDFFAVTRFRPDCFEILVGDVMGKGVPAALVGAGIKNSYSKVLAELSTQQVGEPRLPAPAEIINALHRNLTPQLIELRSFVTLALYRFDIAAGSLGVVNAGHTPGLLARANGGEMERILGDNLPLGVIEDEVYLQQSFAIGPGDALLAYSDGITESFNAQREGFGLARLCAILDAGRAASLPPSSLLQSMRQQVRDFVGRDVLDDDQTAIMVELLPNRRPPRGSIRQRANPSLLILPWDLAALGALRKLIAQTSDHLPEKDVEAIILASFEAATNILRHVKPSFNNATIACRLTRHADHYSVELIYPGSTFSPPRDPQPDFSGNTVGGFGLYIINHCVDAVVYAKLMPGVSSVRLIKRGAGEPGAVWPL